MIHKILIVLAALAAIFFGLMVAQFFLIPEDDYQLEAETALAQADTLRGQTADYEAQLAQQLADGQAALAQEQGRNEELAGQLADAQALNEEKRTELAETEELLASLDKLPELIVELRTEYGETIRQLEDMIVAGESDVKICYLTLDDGPTNITDQFLEKLETYGAYATFFTIGSNSSVNQTENLRAEMMAGHTIANHSFSHAYNTGLYYSLDEFTKQVQLQDDKVYEATGFHTDLFRFPSGSYYCGFRDAAIEWLETNGYHWIDWSANAYDSGANASQKGAAVIAGAMTAQCKTMDICVLLSHDWNYSTLGALDIAIPKLQEAGYVFLPLFPQSCTMGDATRSQFG